MKVLVMTHPVNNKVFEVLFSERGNGNSYKTVDNLTAKDLQLAGYEPKAVKGLPRLAIYRIMAKALAEKILMTAIDSTEDRVHTLKEVGKKLVRYESEYDEDYNIPEVVLSLVNSSI